MLKLQIPKNRMNVLMKQVQLHYEALILERGWEYYHKGRVSDIELVGLKIQALVKGTKTYEAVIDLEEFANSDCNCSSEGFCKHIAALFFSLYAPFGRPELLLQQLKQAIMVRKKTSRGGAAHPDKKPAKPAAPAADSLPQEWHKYFEGLFHGFSISHQNSIETFYQSALETLPPYAKEWRDSIQPIFLLHVVLFIMRKIEQFYQETKSSYLSYYHENGCKAAAEQCHSKLLEIVRGIDAGRSFAAEAKHWEATLSMLGEMALRGKDSPIHWLFVYRMVWWNVNDRGWMQKEIKRLELLLDKTDLLPRRRDALIVARAHFDVALGDTASAFSRLDMLHTRNAGDFFLYLQHYHRLQKWQEALIWLRWLLPAMQKTNHDDFRTFCQFWLDTTKHLDSDSEWVQVMESLLPRSYYYYTAYLLQTNRYTQWVDLQLANRISPLSLYALELRAVEEHDPKLLLPLYHQAVERAVLEKNRASYKTAVKLLKKLHGIYKQMKQEDRFEHYIYRLADKFSRLRAFQEELKKGKWIR